MSIPFLPIGVQWTFETADYGTERTMTVTVQPTEHKPFTVTFDPFPRGFSMGFVTACAENRRNDYLARIAQDRALRECFDRFGVGAPGKDGVA